MKRLAIIQIICGIAIFASAQTHSYKTAFEQIEISQKNNLPQTTIDLADSVFNLAKNDKQGQVMLKSALIKASAIKAINESQSVLHLEYLMGLTPEFDTTELAVLNSMIAEQIWQYYQQNQWRLRKLDETEISDDTTNIATWQANRFLSSIETIYKRSVEFTHALQKAKIANYTEIIDTGDCKTNTHPTLYDLLMGRAIAYFSSYTYYESVTNNGYTLPKKMTYPSVEAFTSHSIETYNFPKPNQTALHYYKDLIAFRLNDSDNKPALFDVVLKWYKYLRSIDNQTNADSLYLNALQGLPKIFEAEKELVGILNYEQAQIYYQQSINETENELNRYKRYEYRKEAHKLAQMALELCKDAEIAPNIQALITQIEEPELEFALQETTLPNQPFLARLNFKNTDTAFVKIYKLNHNQYIDQQQSRSNHDVIYETFATHSQLIDSLQVALPVTDNFFDYKAELWLKALPKGIYLVSMATNVNFNSVTGIVCYQIIQVSELMVASNLNNGNDLVLQVNQRKTGAPLMGATATFLEHRYHREDKMSAKSTSVLSDKYGRITFNKLNNTSVNYIISYKGDTLYNPQSIYMWRESTQSTTIQTDIFTDRAIYRPNQMVYFKILSTKTIPDSLPVINSDFTFDISLHDANGRVVQTKSLTTNELGSANGSFTIPQGALSGNWQLQTQYGNVAINIENYKRPTFNIKFDAPKAHQQNKSEWAITAHCLNYSGTPLSTANYSATITRQIWHWGFRMGNIQGEIVHTEDGKTDPNGAFIIKYNPANYTEKNGQFYQYFLNVTVTNASGESQTEQLELPTTKPITNLTCAIDDQIDMENPAVWVLKNESVNGNPVKATFEIKIHKLANPKKPIIEKFWTAPDTVIAQDKKPFKTIDQFSYVYPDWKSKLEAERENVFVKSGVSMGEWRVMPETLKQWPAGLYNIEITSTDSTGQVNRFEKKVEIFSSKTQKVPYPAIWWINSKNSTVEPGKTATLSIGSIVKLSVLMQVVYKNKTIHTEWITLNKQIKTVNWAVTENLRGGFAINFYAVYEGQAYQHSEVFEVPYSNKKLEFKYLTFRDELSPGSKNQMTITVSGMQNEAKNLEMLAGMYDFSLDKFVTHNWNFSPYQTHYYNRLWQPMLVNLDRSGRLNFRYQPLPYWQGCNEPSIKHFSFFENNRRIATGSVMTMQQRNSPGQKGELMEEVEEEAEVFMMAENVSYKKDKVANLATENPVLKPKVRDNFAETVFFYPELRTDSAGNFNLTYTLPDNLTSYKFMALAHSQSLAFGYSERIITVKKELMATANLPRFVTQGDTISLMAVIENLTDSIVKGHVEIEFSNPFTGQIYKNMLITASQKEFEIDSASNITLEFFATIPDTIMGLQYKLIATAGQHSDGEQKFIPVLSRKKLITETLPIWINGTQTKTFKIPNLITSGKQKSLTHQNLTIEMTANPIWYAIWALPGSVNPEATCNEQIFNNYFASIMAMHIVTHIEGFKNMLISWQQSKQGNFASFLEQNSELKQLLLTQTPWVVEAQSETERLNQLAHFFNPNQLENSQINMLQKLKQNQNSNGSWGWYPAMSENRQITQHIVDGFAKLNAILDNNEVELTNMLNDAVLYLDQELVKDYIEVSKDKSTVINFQQAEYLCIRKQYKNTYLSAETTTALAYFENLASSQWQKLPRNLQAMLAKYFIETNQKELAGKIMKSINEYALQLDEMGIYWKENVSGMGWYQSAVEFQCTMIDAYMAWGATTETIDKLKVWLLKNKQTNMWQTPKSTVSAVYALIHSGTNQLNTIPELELQLGVKRITQTEITKTAQVATGYFKSSFNASEITPEMGNISVKRKGTGISWGGAYWQYFINTDEAPKSSGGMSITKKILVENLENNLQQYVAYKSGEGLKIGQRVKILLTVNTDRPMQFVHISDSRPANFEPTVQASGYNWGNGVGYYQSFDDAGHHFFIDYLPKGNYVFEYDVFVTHNGKFSMGSAVIQSYYSPAFSATSGGMRIKAE